MTPEHLERANETAAELRKYNRIFSNLSTSNGIGIIVCGNAIHDSLTPETRTQIKALVKKDVESLLASYESEFKSL